MRFGQKQNHLWRINEIREASPIWILRRSNHIIFERTQPMTKLISPGELAPDFELDDVQGNRRRLSDFRGKPVVLSLLRGFT